jgi:hypothetical protein
MFIPVACSQCGKPFQVPEQTVGQPTVCPWCQATVLALPIGGPENSPAATEPLPLGDRFPQTPSSRSPRRFTARLVRVTLIVLLAVATTLITIGVLRYKQGLFLYPEWREFVAPDGSCRIELLGRPVDESDTDGQRYVGEGGYSGIHAWVGWRELTPIQVELAASKDGWVSLLPIFAAERDRLKTRYGGVIVKEATRPDSPMTHEVRLLSPDRHVIERMIVRAEGARPRIYFLGLAGKGLDFEGNTVKRFLDSFQIID